MSDETIKNQSPTGSVAMGAMAAVAGWIVPGLGHLLLRRWSKAAVYFLCVGGLACAGLVMRGGVFAAGADAHVTGELAVCAGSCGPGNLHLINGLFDCHRSSVPVLAIAAHIPSAEIGSGYFQETHPQTLFKECSHYCELVSGSNQMPRVL